MENGTQQNGKKVSILKRIEFYITIILIIISASIGWATLQARVGYNEQEIKENKNSIEQIGSKLDDIKDTLNNPVYGLPVLNSRLDRLERDKR